jgi:hypothetical protein
MVELLAYAFVLAAPFWIPIAFAAYAIGRRQYGMRFLFALMTAEAVAVTACWWAYVLISSQG